MEIEDTPATAGMLEKKLPVFRKFLIGRNLKTGEYQRPDGRYEYRYKDEITGKL